MVYYTLFSDLEVSGGSNTILIQLINQTRIYYTLTMYEVLYAGCSGEIAPILGAHNFAQIC